MILITRRHHDGSESLIQIIDEPYSDWLDAQHEEQVEKRRHRPASPPSRADICRRHSRYRLESLIDALEEFASPAALDDWIVEGHFSGAPLGQWVDHYAPFALRAGLSAEEARELYEEHATNGPNVERIFEAFRKAARLTPAQVRAYSNGTANIAQL